MKKFFRILLWVVIGALFIGTFVYLYMNSRPKEVLYSTVTPSRSTIERTTVLTGKIEPRDEITVKPQISGIISEILVEAGNMVQQGDVIAKIKVIPDASQLSSAESRLSVANIELADATVKADRDRALFEKKVISREEFETAQKTLDKAREEVTAATDALRIVKEGVSAHNAKESNTLVRATITGLVLDVPVKVGSSVIQANTMNDGTTVATIADMSNLIFKGNVDETEVGMLSVGMPMSITIGAMPELNPAGTIEFISPKGSDSSGANTFEIKAALEIADGANLRSGYSANATVSLAKAADVISLPESVIEFKGDSTFVYVLTDSVANPVVYTRKPITTGLSNGIIIEVKDGIDSTSIIRSDVIK